ncbi:hypothetical protein B7C51_02280 [Paenibacillus larvae subsp. pulvifaciens]|uniref:DUF4145 domain-containing protein n=2 Tax=Paenibacillus larvae TaxID=1464 RepID=A0A1V0UNN5_9BACL|nr:DUF4145 domain-containing protein [Paenibacillus larvae]ARF66883.1 hypothetical protein B7C51_02280 [Paenibacillus larvae subsp. pulvifaciens]
MASQNFSFLAPQWEVLDKVAETAERNVYQDPNTAISKIRTFAETIAKYISAFEEVREDSTTTQVQRLNQFKYQQIVPREMIDLFHTIRLKGNKAVHKPEYGDTDEAKALLHMAFRLSVWFMEVYGDWKFKAPAYQEPSKENLISKAELEEITQLYENKLAQMEEELQRVRSEQLYVNEGYKDRRRKRSLRSGSNLQLTEDETRILIDQQLMDAGWEADSKKLRFSKGTRPEKGKNLAIAEWPLKKVLIRLNLNLISRINLKPAFYL